LLRVALAVAFLFGCTPLFAVPRKNRSQTEASHAAQTDAFPQSTSADERDLQLKPGDEKMADAFAAYIEGFIAEDDANNDKALTEYQRALTLDPSNSALAVKVAFALAHRV